MNIHKVYNFFLPYFRKRRMRRFYGRFPAALTTATILDVGGYPWFWREQPTRTAVTVVNTDTPAIDLKDIPNVRFLAGDGCALQFADRSFDIGFSNSVIEHLAMWENQQKFASEIRRVAKGIWVQTPARGFFIDPHLLTPFIHWLPKSLRRLLIRRFTIWGLVTKPSPTQVEEFLDEVRLLTYGEMQLLFPDCRIERERFLFMTKAFVAVR